MIEPFQPLRYLRFGFRSPSNVGANKPRQLDWKRLFHSLGMPQWRVGRGSHGSPRLSICWCSCNRVAGKSGPYPRCMVDSVALLRLRSAIDVRLDIEMEYGEDHHVAAQWHLDLQYPQRL